MTVLAFRLPSSEPRRKVPDRRNQVIRIDSRRSLVDPTRTIRIPVLRQPQLYDWANELDE